MRRVHRLVSGIRALLRKDHDERELDEELHAFLQADVDERLRSGMSREDALRAARLHIGSLEGVKERTREVGWESRFESIWQDLRYAVRGLRRSPGFAAAAVLTLAFGIGANSAIFSVVNGLLLRALPVSAPEQLAMVSTRDSIEQGFPAGWNYAVWKQIHDRRDLFGRSVAWTVFRERFDLSAAGETDPVDGLFVSGDFFDELGIPLTLGRSFAAREDVLGSPESQVAVISHGLWQRRFGGAADVVGRHITIERVPVTIIGVAPPEFFGPEAGRAFEVALPIGAAPIIRNEQEWGTPAGRSFLAVMLRLKPDASIASTNTALRGYQRSMIQATLRPNEIWGRYQDGLLKDPFTLAPAATGGASELRRQYSRPLITILIIAAVVLLIACANMANLLLARATARARELSVRRALGATRWRLAQQTLLESLFLAINGAAAGLLLALWGSRALVSQLSTWSDRVTLDVSLDWRVLAFTSLVAVLTAVLFGAVPAIRASLAVAGSALTESLSQRGADSSSGRVRGSLLLAQVALSVVLLVAAGLFVRTFQRIAAVPLGFTSDRVLVADINLTRAAVGAEASPEFFRRMVDAVTTMPGVVHAALSLNTPVNQGATFIGDFNILGRDPLPEQQRRFIVNYVTPDWFATYGIALREGRGLQASDTAPAPPVVVVNEAFVRKFFPGQSALGHAVADVAYVPEWKPTPRTIVGVVHDSVDQSLRGEAYPTIYHSLAQLRAVMPLVPAPRDISLSVRAASGSPAQLARGVAATLTALEPRLAFTFHPLADQVSAALQRERLVAALAGLFGVLALGLAGVGLYGVTSYGVARRRAEIGIRMALGAQRHDVVGLALRHTLMWGAGGVIVGIAAAAVLTRYVEVLLFGVTPLDPVTFVLALMVLSLVAAVATFVPARRAATVDPMLVLRAD